MARCLVWMLGLSMVLIARLLSSLLPQDGPPLVNYDSSVFFSHEHLITPSSKDDIIGIVKTAAAKGQKVRVVGSGHSWSPVAQPEEILVSLWNFTGIVSIDTASLQVTVKAGTPLKMLNKLLDEEGLAMKNLGSISEQTVAGAISTGTHGTGVGFGVLATLVTRMEFVNGKGELISVSADSNEDLFKAAQVSIGMLGIITEVTLQCEKSFNLRETITVHTLDYCLDNFMSLMESGEHVKLWIEFFSDKCAVTTSNKTEERPRDNPNWTARNIQMYSFEVLLYICSWLPSSVPRMMALISNTFGLFPPHDRVDVSHHVLNIPYYLPVHSEAEVAVALESCPEAIRELWRVVLDHHIPLNYVTEIRSVQADDIWLSPDYRRNSCHITQTIYNPFQQVLETYFREFFAATVDLKLHPRLHWGKYMSVGREEVEQMYPRLQDFARIRAEMDPNGIFLNDILTTTFGFQ